jgi:hypothetical protein
MPRKRSTATESVSLFERLAEEMPEPVEVKPGLWEIKLYAGDKERYLNDRRLFSTKLKVALPDGAYLRLHTARSMVDMPGARAPKVISVEPGSDFVLESTDELKVVLMNHGNGSYHPHDWELSILVEVVL